MTTIPVRSSLLFGAFLFSFSPHALAQESVQSYGFRTAYDLARVCAQPETAETLTAGEQGRLQICGAYIQGFLGLYSLTRADDDPLFCLPEDGVSPDRVRRLFLVAMEHRPVIAGLPAGLSLSATLAAAYSCAPEETASASAQ